MKFFTSLFNFGFVDVILGMSQTNIKNQRERLIKPYNEVTPEKASSLLRSNAKNLYALSDMLREEHEKLAKPDGQQLTSIDSIELIRRKFTDLKSNN